MKAKRESDQKLKAAVDVLIVDDHKIDQQLLSNYLKEYDLSFKVAENGVEALKLLNEITFKLVLLDIEMPVMDGYQMAELLRTELHLTIPIVAITVHTLEAVKAKCFEVGMEACFTKPISKIELVGVLTHFLPQELLSTKHIEYNETADNYEVIDLSYLREVSMGDAAYEREVTEKFIEMVVQEIDELNNALSQEGIAELKRTAHKMLSTIYVMGLGAKLGGHLKAIEYDDLSLEQLKSRVGVISLICVKAKDEAQAFLDNQQIKS